MATIRLDRAPINALNSQVQEELRARGAECARRDDVRAVILWGGEKVFAAGADVKEFATSMSPQDMSAARPTLSGAWTRSRASRSRSSPRSPATPSAAAASSR